jgi:hypothetical protein
LNWFDDTPRNEMRRELLAEVERALTERQPVDRAVPAIEVPQLNATTAA